MGTGRRASTASRRGLVVGLALAALGTAAIAIVLTRPSGSSTPVPHWQSAGDEARTVIVYPNGPVDVSRPQSPLHTLALSGAIPSEPTPATVLTDEDCEPDAGGVSHCVNKVRLDGGSMLVLEHPHRMSEVPCLSPGERVLVRGAV